MEKKSDIGEDELYLLRYGRHFRIDNATKVIVGRTHAENGQIRQHINPRYDTVVKVVGYPGPTTVLQGSDSPENLELAAAICAGYSKTPAGENVDVTIDSRGGQKTVHVKAEDPVQWNHLLLKG
jgi:predicted ribosome quality control (RQC) complex YloA/Tae2 family protein